MRLREEARLQQLQATKDWLPVVADRLLMPTRIIRMHFEEPHHKLMLRRLAAAGLSRLGVCMPIARDAEFQGLAQVGTEVCIQKQEKLPDGRILVEGIGDRFFRIEKAHERDGYHVAKVAYLPELGVPQANLKPDIRVCQELAKQLKSLVLRRVREEKHQCGISSEAGDEGVLLGAEALPEEPMAFAWAILEALPLEAAEKYHFVQVSSQYKLFSKLKLILLQLVEHLCARENFSQAELLHSSLSL